MPLVGEQCADRLPDQNMLLGIDASRALTAQRTGTEGYAYSLLQALLPLAHQRGHRVRLYCHQPPPQGLFSADLADIVHIPFPRLWTHLRLGWEVYRHPPDLFFTPAHVIPFGYYGPSMATIHDLGYDYFPQAHPLLQRLYLGWSTRHNARRARSVIADSQATKRDLITLYGISADKIQVIYPAYDERLCPNNDPSALAQYALSAPYFLFLSTIQPRKNVTRILQAFAQVASQLPHHLVLAGKWGWQTEGIVAELAQLSAETRARIHLLGFVPDSSKAALLTQATALLYPSLYEGFGFPILEAQACDLPVIAATTSSLPEVGGESVFYVSADSTSQLAQAICLLAHSPQQRDLLILAGRDNIRRFSWQSTAKRLLDEMERCHIV